MIRGLGTSRPPAARPHEPGVRDRARRASATARRAGAYLLGALELGGDRRPRSAFAAWRVRGALLPGWTGAPARLVEAVLATRRR